MPSVPERNVEQHEALGEDTAKTDVSGEAAESRAVNETTTSEAPQSATIIDAAQDAAATVANPLTAASPGKDEALDRMIGQMIAVSFAGSQPDEDSVKLVIAQIASGKIGGVLFKGRNIQSVEQLRTLMDAFRKTESEMSPFLMIEHEGGPRQTLDADKGFSAYPSAGELGQSNDPLNAFNVYQNMAEELASFGFNVNLGPVLDLESKNNSAVALSERRSYGASAKHVAAFAKAFRLAHERKAILTVLKYFPGGYGLLSRPSEGKSEEEKLSSEGAWDASELEPYRNLLANSSSGMVMIGHLVDSAISGEAGVPASLSAKAVQTILRDEIGFQGVAITDDLEAADLKERFPLNERVVRALAAGNDIVLIGGETASEQDMPDKIVDIVKEALAKGRLTLKRIEASYDRIADLKRSLTASAKTIASAERQRSQSQASTP